MAPIGSRPGNAIDLDMVLKAMKDQLQIEEVQAWGCALLFDFCVEDGTAESEERRAIAVRKGAVEQVLAAMGLFRDGEELQEHGCSALWALSRHSNVRRAHLAARGVLEVGLRALESHPEAAMVQLWGCALIAELAREEDEAKEARVECPSAAVVAGAASAAVERVLEALASHPGEVQVQAFGVSALARLALKPSGAAAAGATGAGGGAGGFASGAGVGAAIRAMRGHPDSAEVQANCCAALTNLVSAAAAASSAAPLGERDVDAGPEGGGVAPPLAGEAADLVSAALAGHPASAEAQEHGSAALRVLAETEEEAFDRFGRSDVVDSLLEGLRRHPSVPRVQAFGVAALCVLVGEAPPVEPPSVSCGEAFIVGDGVALVVQALRNHPASAVLQEHSHALLRSAGLIPGAAALGRLAQLGGAELVIDAMRVHKSLARVQVYGSALLHDLIAHDGDGLRTSIFTLGGLEVLLRALGAYPDDPLLQECGLAALQSLIFYSPENAAAAAASGAFELIAAAMKRHVEVEEVQTQACLALRNAFRSRPPLAPEAAALGGVSWALGALRAHPGSAATQEFGLTALHAFLPERTGEIVQLGGLELLRDALRFHSHREKVVTIATRLLRDLASDAAPPPRRASLVALGFAELALDSLRAHPAASAIQACASAALAGLLLDEDHWDAQPASDDLSEPLSELLVPADAGGACASCSSPPSSSRGHLGAAVLARELARRSQSVAMKVAARSGIRLASRLLREHPSSVDATSCALKLVQRLTARSRAARGAVARLTEAAEASAAHRSGPGPCAVEAAPAERVLAAMRVHLTSPEVQEQGCAALASLALADPVTHRSVMAGGGVRSIILAMQAHAAEPRVQSQGCVALQNLAAGGGEESSNAIAAAGGIELILSAMQAHEDDANVQTLGCTALQGLVVEGGEPHRLKVATYGGAELVLKTMAALAEFPEVQEHACALLCQLYISKRPTSPSSSSTSAAAAAVIHALDVHMAAAEVRGGDMHCGVLATAGGATAQDGEACHVRARPVESVHLLLNAMLAFPADAALQARSCQHLTALARTKRRGGGGARRLAAAGSMPLVLAAMGGHRMDEHVQKQGVSVLQQLACESESSKEAFVCLDGPERLAYALGAFPGDATVAGQGLVVLQSILLFRHDVPDRVCGAGGIKAIVSTLQLNLARAQVQELGCVVVADLAGSSPQHQADLVAQHGIQTVLRTLGAHMEAPSVLSLAFGALQSLLCNNELGKKKAGQELATIEVVTKVLKKHVKEPCVQAFGMAALQSLTFENEKNIELVTNAQGIGLATTAVQAFHSDEKVQEFGNMLLDTLQPWRKKAKKRRSSNAASAGTASPSAPASPVGAGGDGEGGGKGGGGN